MKNNRSSMNNSAPITRGRSHVHREGCDLSPHSLQAYVHRDSSRNWFLGKVLVEDSQDGVETTVFCWNSLQRVSNSRSKPTTWKFTPVWYHKDSYEDDKKEFYKKKAPSVLVDLVDLFLHHLCFQSSFRYCYYCP